MVQRTTRRLAREAFTLMEMLVVVAIIVALAGIGGYYYLRHVDETKKSVAASQTKTVLSQACQSYYLDNNTWPTSLTDLLQKNPEGKGPYLDSADALKDPWDRPYQYNPAGTNNGGTKPDIWSESPYGQIGNWTTTK
jgi:general secretion pathway protein G